MKCQSRKDTNPIWYHLYKVARVAKFIETQVEWWLLEVGVRGMGSCCSMGTELQFCQVEKVLEIHSMNILNTTILYPCNGWQSILWYQLFTTIKKKGDRI